MGGGGWLYRARLLHAQGLCLQALQDEVVKWISNMYKRNCMERVDQGLNGIMLTIDKLFWLNRHFVGT